MLSLLLATLLTQATMSPSSDLSTNRVRATGAAAYRALRDRFADTVNVKDFGAIGNGVVDDTNAVQLALDAAWASGNVVYFPPGEYVVGNVTLPSGLADSTLRVLTLRGAAATHVAEQYIANRKYGSRIRFNKTNGTHLFTLNTVGFVGSGTYRFENLALVGPDTSTPWTATSGDAIHVLGPSNRIFFDHVNINLFGGGTGINLDTDMEGVTWNDLEVSYCGTGIRTSGPTYGVFNQNTLHNVRVQGNLNLGVEIWGQGNIWAGGLVQSNQKTGVRVVSNAIGNHLDSIWFENDNITSTAGEYAVVIKPSAGLTVQGTMFTNCRFGWIRDRIMLDASAAGASIVNTTFDGGSAAAISGLADALTTSGTINGLVIKDFLPYSALTLGGSVAGLYLQVYNAPLKVGNGIAFESEVDAPSFVASVSGSNGLACAVNGCRIDVGAGTSDYFYSDGVYIQTPTGIGASGFYSNAASGALGVSMQTAGSRIGWSTGPFWTDGAGDPENVVTAPVGSLYSRTDGGAGTTLYVKQSGTGNTGWAAK